MKIILCFAVIWTSGCGFVVDTAYLISDRKTTTTITESRPTGRTLTATEMDATVTPDGRLALTCESRTRSIEVTWSVSKIYRYRGGFDKSTYQGTAFASGFFAAVTALTVGLLCAGDEPEIGCWNMLYGSPLVLDVGWSLIRATTAKPPKLIDKQSSPAQPVIGRALSAEPIACPVQEIFAGTAAHGTSRADELAGRGTGSPRAMSEGAVPMPIQPDGFVVLGDSPQALELLAQASYAGLYFVDPAEGATEISVDRCAVLRAHLGLLTPESRTRVAQECKLPVPETPATPAAEEPAGEASEPAGGASEPAGEASEPQSVPAQADDAQPATVR